MNKLVGYRLRRAQLCYFTDYINTLEEEEIRPGLFGILSIIQANPGLTQTAIANALGNDRSAMVPAIDKLEKLKLVERRISENDKRSYSLFLTSVGEAKYRRLVKKIHLHESHFDNLMTVEEKELLIELLGRLTNVCENKT
ncbi:MAG: MarR family transcriptional regulator [Gammaproteobacteria bacterium]|nr:MarR family transcriptional regulator [Gammaproteobacteria bacterium]